MNTSSLNPVKMRLILSGLVLVVLVIQAVLVFFGFQFLDNASPAVNSTITKSQSSEATLNSLQQAEKALNANSDIIPKADDIAIKESELQEKIINGISEYGRKTDVPIRGFTFSSATNQKAASGGSANPTAPTASTATPNSGAKTPAPKQIQGLSKVTITVDLGGSATYDNVIRFIRLTESSIPFLQLQHLNMTRPSSSSQQQGGSSSSSGSNLIFEAYTKK